MKHGTDKSTAGMSAERVARNDSVFRETNERINAVAADQQVEDNAGVFICECADTHCHELVRMSLTEYSDIRRDARLFLNVPGHEAADQGWGQVIETHDSFVVVEKIGPAGEAAEQLEGSSDPETEAIAVDERRHDDPV